MKKGYAGANPVSAADPHGDIFFLLWIADGVSATCTALGIMRGCMANATCRGLSVFTPIEPFLFHPKGASEISR